MWWILFFPSPVIAFNGPPMSTIIMAPFNAILHWSLCTMIPLRIQGMPAYTVHLHSSQPLDRVTTILLHVLAQYGHQGRQSVIHTNRYRPRTDTRTYTITFLTAVQHWTWAPFWEHTWYGQNEYWINKNRIKRKGVSAYSWLDNRGLNSFQTSPAYYSPTSWLVPFISAASLMCLNYTASFCF